MPAMEVLPALAAFAASFGCLLVLLSPAGRRVLLDRPNQRSLHVQPVPRSGGIAIMTGAVAGYVAAPGFPVSALVLAVALSALSLVDDLVQLPTLLRLAAHLCAAAGFAGLTLGEAEPLVLALLALAIAWYANLYNFMDGSDGLAGGMAVIGFGAYAFAAHQAGHAALFAACIALCGASLAFLLFNFHPARLFMGDVGSISLGFLAGALGVLGWRDGVWPLWLPVLVFAPFVGDATLTLLRRLLRRERVWQAHREHYYQRLVRMGFGHRRTAWIEYAVMAACAAAALFARQAPPSVQAAALAASVLVLATIAIWVDVRWTRAHRTDGNAP
jgi:UDP-N-acetylmuramyl pentapeptide phosphotransferase/UDP-N-acetylglucosamine-1-phosphate transferase